MKISPTIARRLQIYLQDQVAQGNVQPAQDLLEDLRKAQRSSQNWVNWALLKLSSALGLIYLVAIALGWIDRRIGIEELILFTIVLLFNSGIFDRLQEVMISQQGISFKVLQEQVAEVKDRIESQRADLEAQGGAIQNLATAPIQTDAVSANREWIENLLSEQEWKHLTKLHDCEETGDEFFYRKRYSFEVELRRLRTLGFIENKPGQMIGKLAPTGDLTDYVHLTEKGRRYIELRRELEDLGTRRREIVIQPFMATNSDSSSDGNVTATHTIEHSDNAAS